MNAKPNSIRLFLSCVTKEFKSYRDELSANLNRPNVTLEVQEKFIPTGTETLDKLDDYIQSCDAVIHLIGDMTGARAQPSALDALRARHSDLEERLKPLAEFFRPGAAPLPYTQWEAYLALYHGKRLLIAVPNPETGSARDAEFHAADKQRDANTQRASQQAHLKRLEALGRYPEIKFTSELDLSNELLRSALFDLLARLPRESTHPNNLPYASLGTLFKGRDEFLGQIHSALGDTGKAGATRAAAITATATVHGLGGVGKTRAAVEYAQRHAGEFTALLFVRADTPEALKTNLAGLCGPLVLDLEEKSAKELEVQFAAVLRWLQQNPGWFLILDNVDTEPAAREVESLLGHLGGKGQVLITSRLSRWSGNVTRLDLDVLTVEDAAGFLLERTATGRRPLDDDPARARELAVVLGQLALALEQAGAYIDAQRLTFAQYLAEWRGQQKRVLAWYDERVMHYPKSVAVTWQTSFDQLPPAARQLLHRLAWFAPDPIPESLFDVPAPTGAPPAADPAAPRDALAELEKYSLVNRAQKSPTFNVHRLVQAVTRQSLAQDTHHAALTEALRWLDDAFVGDPYDVRSWPVLDPLAPHAEACAQHAEQVGITDHTARLLSYLGLLYKTKAQHAQAERMMRRALTIDENSFGTEHPNVAIRLNNLATLLQATNRLAEAEPLMRRALAIDENSFGTEHPEVATDLNNLAQLLQTTNRLAEVEPLMRRALAIDENSFGTDHPNVAGDLNNLATLLHATNRLAEAEPLMRRALAIDELSFGPDHPDVAIDLNNLAQLLQATNRLAEAEPLIQQMLEIFLKFTRATGHPHPQLQAVTGNYVGLLMAMGHAKQEALRKLRELAPEFFGK